MCTLFQGGKTWGAGLWAGLGWVGPGQVLGRPMQGGAGQEEAGQAVQASKAAVCVHLCIRCNHNLWTPENVNHNPSHSHQTLRKPYRNTKALGLKVAKERYRGSTGDRFLGRPQLKGLDSANNAGIKAEQLNLATNLNSTSWHSGVWCTPMGRCPYINCGDHRSAFFGRDGC